jgi:hypothetical protein
MGQAKIRQINEGKVVQFDFNGIEVLGLPDVPEAKRQLLVNILAQIVRAAFPQGQDRRDGRIWSAWQESLLDKDEMSFEVTLGMVDWLKKCVEDEKLKLDPTLAQPREALADYLGTLKAEEPTA